MTDLMHRSGLARHLVAFVAAVVVLLSPMATSSALAVAAPIVPAVADDAGAGDPPPITVSDFYPEENNLSDCVGLAERPGCGSEARGGWAQTAVFIILMLGMAFIFVRIGIGVRRNRND